MEVLKLKIFDVLTEKISVLEFENWIYNSEEFMSQINTNSFYFDVVSINYKDEKWSEKLALLIKEKYDEYFLILYEIQKSCLEIIKSKEPKQVYQILSKLLVNFDYDTDYDILWEFYSLKNYFELYEEGIIKKHNLLEEAKFYSEQIIFLTKNCKSFEETKQAIMLKLLPFKSEKTTLKQKLFAFFKKS